MCLCLPHDCSGFCGLLFLWESRQREPTQSAFVEGSMGPETTSPLLREVTFQGPSWPLLPAVDGEVPRVDLAMWSADGLCCSCCSSSCCLVDLNQLGPYSYCSLLSLLSGAHHRGRTTPLALACIVVLAVRIETEKEAHSWPPCHEELSFVPLHLLAVSPC